MTLRTVGVLCILRKQSWWSAKLRWCAKAGSGEASSGFSTGKGTGIEREDAPRLVGFPGFSIRTTLPFHTLGIWRVISDKLKILVRCLVPVKPSCFSTNMFIASGPMDFDDFVLLVTLFTSSAVKVVGAQSFGILCRRRVTRHHVRKICDFWVPHINIKRLSSNGFQWDAATSHEAIIYMGRILYDRIWIVSSQKSCYDRLILNQIFTYTTNKYRYNCIKKAHMHILNTWHVLYMYSMFLGPSYFNVHLYGNSRIKFIKLGQCSSIVGNLSITMHN